MIWRTATAPHSELVSLQDAPCSSTVPAALAPDLNSLVFRSKNLARVLAVCLKANVECRSRTLSFRAALHRDLAIHLLHKSLADRQPKASSCFVRVLVLREPPKVNEEVAKSLLRYARPVVYDANINLNRDFVNTCACTHRR